MMKTNNNDTKDSLGLYIHIPFCVQKCNYCDFLSFPIVEHDMHLAYVLKIIHEMRARRALLAENSGKIPEVDTVYIGGGTPSLLDAGLIIELLDAVYATFRVADGAEITLEVNPGTVNLKKLQQYYEAGVNRLSIGAQSFDRETLAFLGRIHTAADTVSCVADARAAGFENISLDLIFGVPGQTQAAWQKDLETAACLDPAHISFYALQIEDETPLYKDFRNGLFEPVDEIADRRMYHLASDFLREQGYLQYEISNSALPGMESRHNLKYWSMEPYIGLGAGAHSYVGGRRFSNTTELSDYLSAEDETDMTAWAHENTLSDDMSEYIFLGLRRTAGIELSRFHAYFGREFWELYGEETEKLIKRGLLEKSGDILRLTALGLDLANSVFLEYI